MNGVVFEPWIGSEYETTGLYGLKILVLGESHYGEIGTERRGFTADVVRWLGQEVRHSFFTKTAKLLLLKDSSHWLSDDERVEFWEKVAFYNYVQEFVSDRARIRPTDEMWTKSEPAFHEVIEFLKPDFVLVLGKDLSNHLPSIQNSLETCAVHHPSYPGFRYATWLPVLKDSLIAAGGHNL